MNNNISHAFLRTDVWSHLHLPADTQFAFGWIWTRQSPVSGTAFDIHSKKRQHKYGSNHFLSATKLTDPSQSWQNVAILPARIFELPCVSLLRWCTRQQSDVFNQRDSDSAMEVNKNCQVQNTKEQEFNTHYQGAASMENLLGFIYHPETFAYYVCALGTDKEIVVDQGVLPLGEHSGEILDITEILVPIDDLSSPELKQRLARSQSDRPICDVLSILIVLCKNQFILLDTRGWLRYLRRGNYTPNRNTPALNVLHPISAVHVIQPMLHPLFDMYNQVIPKSLFIYFLFSFKKDAEFMGFLFTLEKKSFIFVLIFFLNCKQHVASIYRTGWTAPCVGTLCEAKCKSLLRLKHFIDGSWHHRILMLTAFCSKTYTESNLRERKILLSGTVQCSFA